MKTSKGKTFSALNGSFLNSETLKINEDHLNDNLRIYLLNNRHLYGLLQHGKHSNHFIAWQALILVANALISFEELPRSNQYYASNDQLKSWLNKYGRGYETIAETVAIISELRKEERS